MMQDGPELRDIHLPPDPSWWPPAPGWWLLALALTVLLYWLWRRLLPRWRHRRLRRLALAELERIFDSAQTQQSPSFTVQQLSAVLRRVALIREPAATRLQGEAWLTWLDSCDDGELFSRGPGRELLESGYKPVPTLDPQTLQEPLRKWLKRALS